MIIFKKPDKKSLLYLSIVIIIAILVCVGYFWYSSKTETKETNGNEELYAKLIKEIKIKKQIKELEEERSKLEPLSKEEIQNQIKELEQFRKQNFK